MFNTITFAESSRTLSKLRRKREKQSAKFYADLRIKKINKKRNKGSNKSTPAVYYSHNRHSVADWSIKNDEPFDDGQPMSEKEKSFWSSL